MAERIPLLCTTAEMASASGSSVDSPGGRAGSGPLAVTVGRAGVGKKVGQGEREVSTQAALRRQKLSPKKGAEKARLHRPLLAVAQLSTRTRIGAPHARALLHVRGPAPRRGWSGVSRSLLR